jgi:hypothetical protein
MWGFKAFQQFKPAIGTFYPKGNEICAYCEPAFPEALVPPTKISEILTLKHTITEWAVIFKEFEDDHAAFTGRDDIGVKASFESRVHLKPPAKRLSNANDHNGFLYYTPSGLKSVLQQPDLGNDILADWISNPPTFLPPELSTFIRGTRSFLLDYEQWWKRPFSEAFDMLTTTKDDLYLLKQACERLLLSVGNPATIDGMDFPDIWTALDYIGSTKLQPANTMQIQADLASLKDVVNQLPTHLNDFNMKADFATHNDLSDFKETLEKFHNRFHVISPILQQVKTLTQEFKNLSSKHPSAAPSSHHRAFPILGSSFCYFGNPGGHILPFLSYTPALIITESWPAWSIPLNSVNGFHPVSVHTISLGHQTMWS